MLLELAPIKGGQSSLTWEGEIHFLDLEAQDEASVDTVYLSGTVSRLGDLITLRADVSTTLKRSCDMCLKPVELHVSTDFLALIKVLRRNETAHELMESDTDIFIPVAFDTIEVDISEHLREALLLAMPMGVYCKTECKGLCPSCGINRNDETCSCIPPANSMWAALEGLR